MNVLDNVSEQRFEAQRERDVVGILDYQISGRIITLTHTVVPKEYEGQGVASALTSFALDQARATGQLVTPKCSFVAAYMRRHPAYLDLLA